METYLDRAGEGDRRARSYFLGLFLILFFWQFLGAIAAGIVAVALRPPDVSWSEALRSLKDPFRPGAVRGGLALLPMFLFGLAGVLLAVRQLLRRPVLSLVAPREAFDWRRFFVAAGLWAGLGCLTGIIRFALAPSWYQVSLDPVRFLAFLPLALLLIPIQIAFEELLFRGYLMQWLSLASRKPWFLVAASALLFALPHLANPEATESPRLAFVYYLGTGAFLAAWAIRDGRLESVLGVHVANNLFGALILSFQSSVFQTPTIFYCRRFEPRLDLLELIATGVAFTLLTRRFASRGLPSTDSASSALRTRIELGDQERDQ